MWDDEINKKIKDAADQYHPAYDENAWDKMELLLDQHLPVREKKKRRYFWIPFITLLVGGLFFVFYYSQTDHAVENSKGAETKKDVATPKLPQQEVPTTVVPLTSSPLATTPASSLNSGSPGLRNKVASDDSGNSNGKPPGNISGKSSLNKSGKTDATVIIGSVEQETTSGNNAVENSINNEPQNSTKENDKPETETTIVNNPVAKEEFTKIKSDTASNAKEVAKSNNAKESNKKKVISRGKRFGNNFGLDFSAGPDISGVGFNAGRVAINYGIGASYAMSGKFTLRSGFYISDKIYSADKDEYHVPTGGSNVDYLYNIDANCKVYEIPVIVDYNFAKSKNHQWFVSAGLSSYLMRKESYDYYYEYPSGNTYTKSWSISNQNQHYFSVLDLSGGYKYMFTKKASLLIEPYLKIPLSGLGAGKVKVNSGGVLFTYTLKPFYKK
jgi:hypothetical protein